MYSSYDLGALEFCAKLLLGCSSQFSLFNAANFLLFRVVILKEKYLSVSNTLLFVLRIEKINLVLTVTGKVMKEI